MDNPEVFDIVEVKLGDGSRHEGQVLAVTRNGRYKVEHETGDWYRTTGNPKKARGIFKAEDVELLRRDC